MLPGSLLKTRERERRERIVLYIFLDHFSAVNIQNTEEYDSELEGLNPESRGIKGVTRNAKYNLRNTKYFVC